MAEVLRLGGEETALDERDDRVEAELEVGISIAVAPLEALDRRQKRVPFLTRMHHNGTTAWDQALLVLLHDRIWHATIIVANQVG